MGLAAGLAAASTESGQLHAALRANEGLAARAANAEAAASRLPALTASNAALTLRVDNLQVAHDRLQVRRVNFVCADIMVCATPPPLLFVIPRPQRANSMFSATRPPNSPIIAPEQGALSRRTPPAQPARLLQAVMDSSSDVRLVPTTGDMLLRRRRTSSWASS